MTLLLDGWLVADGRLAAAPPDLPAATPRLDCGGAALRPGAVNAHTHLYSGLAPFGLPPPAPPPRDFVEILERVWWRLDRALDERSLRAAARWAIAEALLAGTTTLVDHHESPRLIAGSLDILADAAQELGARLVVGYGATERNGGRDEAARGLAECARFARDNRRPRVTGLVALHASFTVSDETIREAGALARTLGVGVHVHVAEDGADVDDARRRGFPGPLERLLELGALPPRSIVAHGVCLTEAQVRRADEAGAWLVHNPRSNEGNRVGYARALRASAHVALGTDGWPADMEVERAALLRLGRAAGDADAVLEARAAAGGELLGALLGDRFGRIEAGARADLVVGAPGAPPRHVLVDGRPVVVDGALVTADLEEIRARAREEAPRLWARMAEIGGSP
jgi:cytosine/adenosine deaminase-related metal-dependent hydrolase